MEAARGEGREEECGLGNGERAGQGRGRRRGRGRGRICNDRMGDGGWGMGIEAGRAMVGMGTGQTSGTRAAHQQEQLLGLRLRLAHIQDRVWEGRGAEPPAVSQ